MTDRRHRADFYRALKTDFGLLVDEIGTQSQAAELTRVDQQALSSYENRNRPEFAPIDVVADLLDKAGTTHVVRMLADVIGAIVVPLPRNTGPMVVVEGAGQMAQALGKAMVAIGTALADGKITAEEAEIIIPKLQSIILSAHSLIRQINAEVGK
ncbi:MAG: hypothetical protein P0Y65_20580 [Candidatus Devosia phytovorans]|uniref:Uncharacterized protein n=1 Tax=Candidatus Devosia phytovorans TaxID=3121372 RepID=A0AAJ6B0R5_9HYPH|nr:phage regulatory CII family protein [Devosia sp.]WEK04539.1 MAG: hypothetical protein P0Y65_20580 [Devosia sp.]